MSEPETVYEWARRYRRIEGHSFSLDRYKPLRALYEDDHDHIVVMKPAQRGVSEWAISLACFGLEYGARRWGPTDYVCEDCERRHTSPVDECENCAGQVKAEQVYEGINVGTVFPARTDLNEFSKERLSNLKDESTHLAALFDNSEEFDSLSFKQVGNSFWYLRGGYSEAGLRSFKCDMLILDEFDELAEGAVALARRRLNASLIHREIDISTPTIPGAGISKAYAATDQRVYETPCEFCATECSFCGRPADGHAKGDPCPDELEDGTHCPGKFATWNRYDFFRDVYVDGQPWDEWQKWTQAHIARCDVDLRCPNCHQVQSLAARCGDGRWVALEPEVTSVHGYHVPWWPWEFTRLDRLAQAAVSDDPNEQEQFYRSDLGIPHGAAGGQITDDMLKQLSAELDNGQLPKGPWSDTVLGADIGARIHYTIDSIGPGGFVYVRKAGSVAGWAELDALMEEYHVRQAVVDAEPEILTAEGFCKKWKGRAMRCFYPTQATALKDKLYVVKEDTYDMQANRSTALDLLFATIKGGTERWPLDIATNDEMATHLKNMTRTMVTAPDTGLSRYNWIRTGPDHLAHARVYAILARKTLPVNRGFAPAVAGTRPVVADHQRVAALDLGRIRVGDRMRLPSWIPPGVR